MRAAGTAPPTCTFPASQENPDGRADTTDPGDVQGLIRTQTADSACCRGERLGDMRLQEVRGHWPHGICSPGLATRPPKPCGSHRKVSCPLSLQQDSDCGGDRAAGHSPMGTPNSVMEMGAPQRCNSHGAQAVRSHHPTDPHPGHCTPSPSGHWGQTLRDGCPPGARGHKGCPSECVQKKAEATVSCNSELSEGTVNTERERGQQWRGGVGGRKRAVTTVTSAPGTREEFGQGWRTEDGGRRPVEDTPQRLQRHT